MGIADYKPATTVLPFAGGTFTVRGLSLDDVAVLINTYLPDVDKLFELYSETVKEDVQVLATAQYAIGLCRDAPSLVGHLLALANNEPAAIDGYRKLPMTVQVEMLKAILHLTFLEAGGAKKFFAGLTTLIGMVAPPVKTDSRT